MFRWKIAFVVMLALTLIAIVGISVVIVDQSETVYVPNSARPIRRIDEPGLNWKRPWQSRRA